MLRKARLEQKLEEERRLEEIESQKQRDERLIAAMPVRKEYSIDFKVINFYFF